jgi:hypothetical protein
VPKASEFYKKKLLKNDEIGPGLLSKVAGAVLPNFQERTINRTYLTDLKTGKVNPGRFSKALGAAPRNLLSNRSKGFGFARFLKSFQQIQKLLAPNDLNRILITGVLVRLNRCGKNYVYIYRSIGVKEGSFHSLE